MWVRKKFSKPHVTFRCPRINDWCKTMKTLALAHLPPLMDRARFSELIRDHHRPLLAYARVLAGHPERAGELVQDSFVAAWQVIGRFDVTRDFGSWLRGIVRNKWREDCRRNHREVPLEDPEIVRLEEAMRAQPPQSIGPAPSKAKWRRNRIRSPVCAESFLQ